MDDDHLEAGRGQRRPCVRAGLQRDVGHRHGGRALRDRERHGGPLRSGRVAGRALVDDLAGRLVRVDVDPADREARRLELRGPGVVALSDDARHGHRLGARRDVDPHRGAGDDDDTRLRVLRGDLVRLLR